MNTAITQAEQDLYLLQSLIPSGESFHIWGYSNEGQLLGCSCQGVIRETLHHAFQALGAYEKMLEYAVGTDHHAPRILGSSIGIQWAVTLEKERKNNVIFVLGPVLNMPANEKTIRSMLISSQLSLKDTAWIEPLCTLIPMLPVMSYAVFGRYVMLVHNVLTGSQLGMEALNPGAKTPEKEQAYAISQRNRLDVYKSEQALLDVALLRADAAAVGICDISQKGQQLLFRFTDRVDPPSLLAVCSMASYKGRLLLHSGSQPYLTLYLKEKENSLQAAAALTEQLRLKREQ